MPPVFFGQKAQRRIVAPENLRHPIRRNGVSVEGGQKRKTEQGRKNIQHPHPRPGGVAKQLGNKGVSYAGAARFEFVETANVQKNKIEEKVNERYQRNAKENRKREISFGVLNVGGHVNRRVPARVGVVEQGQARKKRARCHQIESLGVHLERNPRRFYVGNNPGQGHKNNDQQQLKKRRNILKSTASIGTDVVNDRNENNATYGHGSANDRVWRHV